MRGVGDDTRGAVWRDEMMRATASLSTTVSTMTMTMELTPAMA
jgi:hypothetical protein